VHYRCSDTFKTTFFLRDRKHSFIMFFTSPTTSKPIAHRSLACIKGFQCFALTAFALDPLGRVCKWADRGANRLQKTTTKKQRKRVSSTKWSNRTLAEKAMWFNAVERTQIKNALAPNSSRWETRRTLGTGFGYQWRFSLLIVYIGLSSRRSSKHSILELAGNPQGGC